MIRILYTCGACGLEDVGLDIRERGENEDVIQWMNDVVKPALGEDHRRRSPYCLASTLDAVKIPNTGTQRIGQSPKN